MKPAVDAARRASERAAGVVHLELKKRVDNLATIVVIAPWLGLFGTVFGIVFSFTGVDGERSTIMAALAANLSAALTPAACGLLVGLIASCFRSYLLSQVETLDFEMESATFGLLNDLSG
jgi:biopolymer transport protein TolQ